MAPWAAEAGRPCRTGASPVLGLKEMPCSAPQPWADPKAWPLGEPRTSWLIQGAADTQAPISGALTRWSQGHMPGLRHLLVTSNVANLLRPFSCLDLSMVSQSLLEQVHTPHRAHEPLLHVPHRATLAFATPRPWAGLLSGLHGSQDPERPSSLPPCCCYLLLEVLQHLSDKRPATHQIFI